MRQGPELAHPHRDRALEVIGRGGLHLLDQAEHDVGGWGEAGLCHPEQNTIQCASYGLHYSGGTMPQLADSAALTQDLTAGFESLDRETRVDRLPIDGRLPDWLQGSLVRTGPAKWEVGEPDDEPLVRRLRDAPSLRHLGRRGLLRQPLPPDEGLPRRRGEGRDRLLRVRHRSVPFPLRRASSRCSPRRSPTTPTSTW